MVDDPANDAAHSLPPGGGPTSRPTTSRQTTTPPTDGADGSNGGGRSGEPGARHGPGGGGSATPPGDWRRLSSLFERLPPHAIEAEMSLLGSMLLDPRVIGDVVLILGGGDDFSKPSHGVLYDAMVELYDERASLDLVQLHQLMVDRGTIEEVGGPDYLVELAESVPTASNAAYYARLVKEKATIRHLITAAGEILYEAYHAPDDARTILEQAEQRIFQIAQRSEQSAAESLQDLVDQLMQQLAANEGQQITGVPTQFAELDEMTGGMQKGELLILAARPSMGKTALALNIAEQVAAKGKSVGVFSLEMGKQQLVQRLLCAVSGVDSQRVRRNILNRTEWDRLLRACDQLEHAPIYIDDTPGLTLLQLRAKARRMVARHGIEAIVIDYLQLMTAGGRTESRQQEVSAISRGVKAMARELDLPVLCLSQLNRAAEQREGHRPRMSDLRESGSIEQDADVIMMLHREEYYHQADPAWAEMNEDKVGVAELILAKQRNGPTGTVRLVWDSGCTRFRSHSWRQPPGGFVEVEARTSEPADPFPGRSGGAAGQIGDGTSFDRRRPTGPPADHRDGGGPDRDDDELPPF